MRLRFSVSCTKWSRASQTKRCRLPLADACLISAGGRCCPACSTACNARSLPWTTLYAAAENMDTGTAACRSKSQDSGDATRKQTGALACYGTRPPRATQPPVSSASSCATPALPCFLRLSFSFPKVAKRKERRGEGGVSYRRHPSTPRTKC